MQDPVWYHGTPRPKFTRFGHQVSIGQTPNYAKFRHPATKSVRDISCGKFVLSTKWTKVHQNPLNMICNDFLVVKVNCWLYVFNIIKSMLILRNIKKKENCTENRLKVRTDDLFTFRK